MLLFLNKARHLDIGEYMFDQYDSRYPKHRVIRHCLEE